MESILNMLYEFGQKIAEVTKGVNNIMTSNIIAGVGGTNFSILEIMLGSFFIIYVPLQLIKWLIP